MKHIIYIALSLSMFTACSKSDDTSVDAADGQIRIKIALPTTATRASGDVTGNEGKINSLAFYFFNAAGSKLHEEYIGADDLADAEAQPDWVSGGIVRLPKDIKPLVAAATSVYVVANLRLEAVTDRTALFGAMADGLPTDDLGNFVMEGGRESDTPFDPDIAPMVTVQIKRLATKLRLHITLGMPGSNDLADVGRWADGARYLVRNQITKSYVVENDSVHLNDIDHTDNNITYFYQGGTLPAGIAAGGGTMPETIKYTYEHYWIDCYDDATYVVLQLPYTTATGKAVKANFYRFALDQKRIPRNHIYEVYVTVNTVGSNYPDIPAEINPSEVKIYDWINVDIGADVVNDYIYVPSTKFNMYGEVVSFRYKASGKPAVYLTTAEEAWDDNVILPADEAYSDVSDYSMGEGTAYIHRVLSERFSQPAPRTFYAFFHVRSIVKTVSIDQYPYSYFGKKEDGTTDYYHILTPKDTEEYPIGYCIEDNIYYNAYTTLIHEAANLKVSQDFIVQNEPVVVDGASLLDTEYLYPINAKEHCVRLQRASGDTWVLPTVRQWQLVAEACRKLISEGKVSPVPAGVYFVAQSSTSYAGYVVNIPDGTAFETYSGEYYKTRCVRNE